jgi:hypothetical protein
MFFKKLQLRHYIRNPKNKNEEVTKDTWVQMAKKCEVAFTGAMFGLCCSNVARSWHKSTG